MTLKCPYCGKDAALVPGSTVYPHRADLHVKQFWYCRPCDAYVGCHELSARPLGRLANAELRRAKSAAHRAFDSLWRRSDLHGRRARIARGKTYAWLAAQMEIARGACHIGMFDEAQCRRVVELVDAHRQNTLNP